MKALDDLTSSTPEAALRKVYADNFPWLVRYVCQNTGKLEDAEDVFQESVSVAWLNLKEGRFRGDSEQFNAYVRQICKYKWINQLKSAAHTRIVWEEDLSLFEEKTEDTELLNEQLEQTKRLNASFADLGEKCRKLLGRFYFKRQPLAKIAEAMNSTEESIKTIKYRCMMQLRKIYLEKHHGHE